MCDECEAEVGGSFPFFFHRMECHIVGGLRQADIFSLGIQSGGARDIGVLGVACELWLVLLCTGGVCFDIVCIYLCTGKNVKTTGVTGR